MQFRGWIARVSALGAALGLAACMPQIESAEPLLDAAPHALRPGLWALLKDDCAAPEHGRIFDWPPCAMPVRVRPGELTIISPVPLRARLVLGGTAPLVVQARISEEEVIDPSAPDSSAFTYYSFVPVGGEPLASGEVRILRCPADDEMPIEGITLDEEGSDARCVAATAQAVREAARRSLIKRPDWRAVWITELQ